VSGCIVAPIVVTSLSSKNLNYADEDLKTIVIEVRVGGWEEVEIHWKIMHPVITCYSI